MGIFTAPGQPHHKTSGVRVPVRRSKSCKGWNNINAIGILHLTGQRLRGRGTVDHLHGIPQPLDGCTGYKHTALQGVFYIVAATGGDGGHQAMIALHRAASGIHQ